MRPGETRLGGGDEREMRRGHLRDFACHRHDLILIAADLRRAITQLISNCFELLPQVVLALRFGQLALHLQMSTRRKGWSSRVVQVIVPRILGASEH